jgi:hypothetical protein
MAEDNLVNVDYTSRDYYALRDELIARIKFRIPEWQGSDESDFGLALAESFAYMGDVANYYIDRIANENFLATATQRESILSTAETYGYAPSGYSNALVDVTFYNNSNAQQVLPAGTRVSGDIITDDETITVTFTTLDAVTIPAFANSTRGEASTLCEEGISNTVEAGSVYGVLLGSSSGTAEQAFDIDDDPVVLDSINVYVESGNTFGLWTRVQHLIDYGPNDAVYTVRFDSNNRLFVVFGDGVSGAIPTVHSAIRATYTIGGGSLGNIKTGIINTLEYVPGLSEQQVAALSGIIDINNTSVGAGGLNPESDASIRANAPLFLRAQNRAITIDDYQNLALAVENCGKAKAISSGYTSVTMYVGPRRDDIDGDPTPGIEEISNVATPTIEWNNLRDAVVSFLSDKTLAGVSLTITQPTYVPVTMNIQYKLDPAFTTAVAERTLKQALISNFGYNYVNFGERVSVQDVEYIVNNIPGILRAKCQYLFKTGGSQGIAIIQALDNEILSFAESDIILEATLA